MKLGLGLYRHLLTRDNFRFARQCGCTHLIVHLAEYYAEEVVPSTNDRKNYGTSMAADPIWEFENLQALQKMAREEGLEIYGIENFSPADWYDVLLDGPCKERQMEFLKKIITNTGKAGIRAFGYNFSLAGVWGHQKKSAARGGALTTCFKADELPIDSPIPQGEVWNMNYDSSSSCQGFLPELDSEELWERFHWFLQRIMPAAEEAGIEMALHPDDPPMPFMRRMPRLVYRADLYQRALDLVPSPANKIEFCMGSIQEMEGSDIYEAIKKYRGKLSYIHFRNVKGKIPDYQEVFLDEGDIDMLRCLRLLHETGFEGPMVPDHTPEILCAAPWHAGMAFALGYMRAGMQLIDPSA
jgi:mannonate dehydratase